LTAPPAKELPSPVFSNGVAKKLSRKAIVNNELLMCENPQDNKGKTFVHSMGETFQGLRK
jgi:hypothetical protein